MSVETDKIFNLGRAVFSDLRSEAEVGKIRSQLEELKQRLHQEAVVPDRAQVGLTRVLDTALTLREERGGEWLSSEDQETAQRVFSENEDWKEVRVEKSDEPAVLRKNTHLLRAALGLRRRISESSR